MNAAQPAERLRGIDLLLAHCSALDYPRLGPSPYERLQDALGDELARLLVAALTRGSGRAAPPPAARSSRS